MDMKTIIDLKGQRKTALDAAEKAFQAKDTKTYDEKMADVKKLNTEIEGAEALLAESGRFKDSDEKMLGLTRKQEKEKEEATLEKSVDKIRSDPEYARTWAKALRAGMTVKKSRGMEDFAILHKALTISGGTNVGEDGGYLVPTDFDNMIIQETKDFVDISKLFHVETVTTYSGWRAVETAGQRTKLPLIGENTTIGKANQPKFTKVNYSVKKYGDRLVVSSELMEDNTAGLMQYLAQWFGPKYILTKNDLLLTLLNALAFTPQTADTDAAKVKAIKTILNKGLNTAHSRAASILTNQNVYNEMDNWVDGQNRPMLVPDVSGDFDKFKGRPLVYADNDEIGTKTVDPTIYDPMFIGNFRALGTLFVRKAMEVAATDVGGDAWANDAYELRCLCRLDAQSVDTTAVVATGYAQQ